MLLVYGTSNLSLKLNVGFPFTMKLVRYTLSISIVLFFTFSG